MRKAVQLSILLSLALLGTAAARAADEWKAVFDPYQVITLHLELSPVDWDRVRHDQPSQTEGQAYVIEGSADLVQWTSLATNVAGQNGAVLYIDALELPPTHRFYRARPLR